MQVPLLFWNEFRRAVLMRWSYRLDALSWLVIWGIAFPLILLMFDSVAGGYGTEAQATSLLGFLVWDLCMGTMTATTQMIHDEAQEGTLEAIFLSSITSIGLALLRIAAVFTLRFIETLLLGGLLALVLGVSIPLNGTAFLVFLLTVLGVAGVGLALGGLALIYKNIASIVGVVGLLALFLTGAILPLNDLGLFFNLLKYILPTTWGIEALRSATLGGVTLTDLVQDGTLIGLTIQASLCLAIGIYLFHWGFYRARQEGQLGTY